MKAKILVFFGIIAVGVAISLFTLTRKDSGDSSGRKGAAESVSGAESAGEKQASDPGKGEGKGSASGEGAVESKGAVESTTGDAKPASASEGSGTAAMPPRATPPKEKAAGSEASRVSDSGTPSSSKAATATNANPPAPSSAPEPAGTSPAGMKSVADPVAREFRENKETPEGIIGGLANRVMKKDFQGLVETAGKDSISPGVQAELKKLVEDPNLKLDPKQPFREMAKTRDTERWVLNFVPRDDSGTAKPRSVVVDIRKSGPSQFEIEDVKFSADVKEVVKAVEEAQPLPEGDSGIGTLKLDSLTVARAFSEAVMSEDFISARRLCGPEVTDERIAGLMIALEEGRFQMREDRPLILTLARDRVSWVLSRVNSPVQNSEFALELEKLGQWKINGLTFGKVISSLAKQVDGPYSPIVEDPAGGESLVIYFDFDNAGLSSRASSQLAIVSNILSQDPDRKIRITGHADAVGSDDYNRALSQQRAESIRQAIIQSGISPDQVITEGFGSTKPRKPNFKEDGSDNPTGRSANRRAEVYLDF